MSLALANEWAKLVYWSLGSVFFVLTIILLSQCIVFVRRASPLLLFRLMKIALDR